MRQGSILAYLRAPTLPSSQDSKSTETTSSIPVVADKGRYIEREDKTQHETATVTINEISGLVSGRQVKPQNARITITKVAFSHLDRLKSITSTLLPVRYSDRFFTECLDLDKDEVISFVCLFDAKPVGWIRCRLEPFPSKENATSQQIYIQALGVLAPYRTMGIASALLNEVESSHKGAGSIYAHVWEKNDDALIWYAKRSFRQVLLVPQYYRRLKPSNAWLVRKDLT